MAKRKQTHMNNKYLYLTFLIIAGAEVLRLWCVNPKNSLKYIDVVKNRSMDYDMVENGKYEPHQHTLEERPEWLQKAIGFMTNEDWEK